MVKTSQMQFTCPCCKRQIHPSSRARHMRSHSRIDGGLALVTGLDSTIDAKSTIQAQAILDQQDQQAESAQLDRQMDAVPESNPSETESEISYGALTAPPQMQARAARDQSQYEESKHQHQPKPQQIAAQPADLNQSTRHSIVYQTVQQPGVPFTVYGQTLGPQPSTRLYQAPEYFRMQSAAPLDLDYEAIRSSQAEVCIAQLQALESNESKSGLTLHEHLATITVPAVCRYIKLKKPARLLQLLSEIKTTLLSTDQLAGLICGLASYDSPAVIEKLIKQLAPCSPEQLNQSFKSAKTTLTAMLRKVELADWFIGNYKYVDDQALRALRSLSQIPTQQGNLIMQLQRVLSCPEYELQTLLEELAITFYYPEQFRLLRQLLDQSLATEPLQPTVDKHQLVEIVMYSRHLEQDLGLGRKPVKNWLPILKGDVLTAAQPDTGEIVGMLECFARLNNIRHQGMVDRAEALIKGDLASLSSKTGVSLTSRQIAVAAAALSQLTNMKRQHWELAAGTGKSFIIAAIAAARLAQDADLKVEIVVPSEYLLQRDRCRFQPLWDVVGAERVSYSHQLDKAEKSNTLTIIDEVDALMLQSPGSFFINLNERSTVIMFSGSFQDSQDAFLPKIFKHYHIKAWDCSSIQGTAQHAIFNRHLKSSELDSFIEIERRKHAVIVFISPDASLSYQAKPRPVYMLDTSQRDALTAVGQIGRLSRHIGGSAAFSNLTPSEGSLNTLGPRGQMQSGQLNAQEAMVDGQPGVPFTINLDQRDQLLFPLVIATDEKDLRGIDLRAPKHGLVFIATRPFSTERARQQALGRVGRFGDTCYRVLIEGVQEVDAESERRAFASIVQLALAIGQRQTKAVSPKKKSQRIKKKEKPSAGKQSKLPFGQLN